MSDIKYNRIDEDLQQKIISNREYCMQIEHSIAYCLD